MWNMEVTLEHPDEVEGCVGIETVWFLMGEVC